MFIAITEDSRLQKSLLNGARIKYAEYHIVITCIPLHSSLNNCELLLMRILDKQELSFCKYIDGNQSHLKAFTPE